MWRNTHPKIYELFELTCNIEKPNRSENSYFYKFEEEINHPLSKERVWLLENDLSRLDVEAWNQLKERLRKKVRYITSPNEERCWQQLSDFLNEVKGYIYLQNANYSRIQFVEEDGGEGQTPDWYAIGSEDTALLEVKTINISDDEANFRSPYTPIRCKDIQPGLNKGLERQILANINKAKEQLQNHCNSKLSKLFIVICINLDGGSKVEQNYEEFNEFIRENKPQCVDEILLEQGYRL